LLCKSGMFAGCISVVLFQKDVSFLWNIEKQAWIE
jgi:hypothetical protein